MAEERESSFVKISQGKEVPQPNLCVYLFLFYRKVKENLRKAMKRGDIVYECVSVCV